MSTQPNQRVSATLRWAVLGLLAALALYAVTLAYLAGQSVVGSMVLGGVGLLAYVYSSSRAISYRYLFPGLLGMTLFVVFPLIFTVWIGFTNYSSRNLLTFERATDVLLSKTFASGAERLRFQLIEDRGGYRLLLGPEPAPRDEAPSIFAEPGADEVPAGTPENAAPEGAGTTESAGAMDLVSERFTFDGDGPIEISASPLAAADAAAVGGAPLDMRQVIALRADLGRVLVHLPSGAVLVKASLRAFAAQTPLYARAADGTLVDQQTGARLHADSTTGFYVDGYGDPVAPGFRVTVGFAHFVRIFTDQSFQSPFLRIFFWTVLFALLSVVFTGIVGVLLGELLEWQELRFRGLYRVLLFLPYAVPGFISILVFKGLFNENFGEINGLIGGLFGMRPRWFSDPFLAKCMLLLVNTWLGYPYIMLLWMGLRKSISKDLYEASALAGAGPFTNFFKITWPLVKKPLSPLLISSFAFNFNNFVLISLLTGGRPDFLDSSVPAGTTDILVSYTYRIAFQDSGQNFGLAAAVSAIIFVMVAVLSIINLRLTRAAKQAPRR